MPRVLTVPFCKGGQQPSGIAHCNKQPHCASWYFTMHVDVSKFPFPTSFWLDFALLQWRARASHKKGWRAEALEDKSSSSITRRPTLVFRFCFRDNLNLRSVASHKNAQKLHHQKWCDNKALFSSNRHAAFSKWLTGAPRILGISYMNIPGCHSWSAEIVIDCQPLSHLQEREAGCHAWQSDPLKKQLESVGLLLSVSLSVRYLPSHLLTIYPSAYLSS